MPAASAPLAKLSRPRTPAALARPRLFAALDHAVESHGVWIAGRPGAGKTTLISTWLDVRKRTALWYQVDARDSDPANVFHFLAQSTDGRAKSDRLELPAFTPDARRDLEGFAHRFFAALYRRWRPPHALVFDNVHEADSREFHAVLAAALAETPPGIALILASRDDIPAGLVGARASRALSNFDAASLAVSEEEAVALSSIVGGGDRAAALAIHRRVNGWAAGIVLLANAQPAEGHAIDDHGTEQVFDYFAAEVFEDLDAATQRVLLTTSLLPSFSGAMAVAISGLPAAEREIERCYRRHLFVERRNVRTRGNELERHYQYHPLFAAFLHARAKTVLAAELAPLQRSAIALMAEAGAPDAAIAAGLAAGEVAIAVSLLSREAPRMMREGRHRQLLAWIALADPDRKEPWLGYWAGLAQSHLDQRAARALLRDAFDAFVGTGDRRGQLLAAAAMLEAMQSSWSTFDGFEEWLHIALSVYQSLPEVPDANTELRVLTGIVSGMLLLRPGDPALLANAERLFALLELPGDVNDRMSATICLMPVAEALSRNEWKPRLERIAADLLLQPELAPRRRAEIGLMVELTAGVTNLPIGTFEAHRLRTRAMAEANNFSDLLFRLATVSADSQFDHDLDAAETLLREAERWLDPARLVSVQEYHTKRAQLALLHRDGNAALRHSELAVAAARRAHVPPSLMIFAMQTLPMAHVLCGDFDAAIAAAEAGIENAFPHHAAINRLVAALVRALQAHVEGLPDRAARLQRALGMARELNRLNFLRTLPREAAMLCEAALAAGIEVEFVTRVIRHRRFRPPSPMTESWPWPIRIRAFGPLVIERDGVPLAFAGKAPKKSLDLIKALIAAGGGPTSAADLAAVLWPDADGDAAATTLRVNLHRARKLLGHDEALVLDDGRLSFNNEMVSLDLRAFEACVREIEGMRGGDEAGALTAASARLVALYRGPLLRDDGDAPWLMPARVRCNDALLRSVARAGRLHEDRARWSEAIALYQCGIAADPLAEGLYRALMRSHAAQGRVPDAVRAYRRCREMLSILLGVRPSAATEDLMREIHARQ